MPDAGEAYVSCRNQIESKVKGKSWILVLILERKVDGRSSVVWRRGGLRAVAGVVLCSLETRE